MQKKIVQFLPYSYHIHTGGLEKIAQALSDGFNAEKDVICLNIASDVCRGYTGKIEDTDETIYIPSFDIVYNYPIPKFWTKKFWHTLSQIKKYKPDVIQTHTRFFVQSLIGGLVSKRLGCKRVHVEHGSGFVTGYPWYIKLAAWCFDWTMGLGIFRQCDSIVTISQMHKKFIQKFTSKEPIVIYNPIDYIPQPRIKNKIPHIGFIGRLVSLKGVDLLIQALKQLEDKDWICTIVGEGNQRGELEALTQELGLIDRIIFTGADDRKNWLHKFDIFINPSHQEGLPTTVVEALLAKCIVIATDVGGTKEISEEDDLILIQSNSIEDLSISLEEALNSYSYKNGLSYKHVIKKHKLTVGLQSYIDIYKRKSIVLLSAISGGPHDVYVSMNKHNNESGNESMHLKGIGGWIKSHFIRCDELISNIPLLWRPIGVKWYVFNIHGNYKKERMSRIGSNLLLWLSEWNMYLANSILVPSLYIPTICDIKGTFRKKIIIKANVIDKDFWKKSWKGSSAPDVIIFFTITGFSFYDKARGLLNVANVIKKFAKKNPIKKVLWKIAGNNGGEIFNKIRGNINLILADQENITIEYLGWINSLQIRDNLQRSSYFLYRTYLDNYPLVILQALSIGIPTLVNNYESFPYCFPQKIIVKSEQDMLRRISEI